MSKKSVLTALFLSVGFMQAAQAAVSVFTWEDGGDVISSFSGSLDTDVGFSGTLVPNFVWAESDAILFQGGSATEINFVSVTGDAGSGGVIAASSGTGDVFGFCGIPCGNFTFVSSSYVAGTSIAGTQTFAGTTLAGLGLTVGTLTGTIASGDTVTWNIGTQDPATVVPLPAGLPLALAGLGALAWLRNRKA